MGKFKLLAEGTLINFGFRETISFAAVKSQVDVEYINPSSSHHFFNCAFCSKSNIDMAILVDELEFLNDGMRLRSEKRRV